MRHDLMVGGEDGETRGHAAHWESGRVREEGTGREGREGQGRETRSEGRENRRKRAIEAESKRNR